ncbi:farnesyl-diphosphate farnesyltransferase [Fomitiporia mediterranea MF3/22]|uniref:farnesyl-diphosphate farnesyltransferase n=1 Tax=Fomitiporia mediterranea (strain MF3/22) TaxID=694068 RepID=UPI0004408BB9|nr:farnesyl-diphosphate farnesyltransferase [Fomitiporia mediterranea MF3/22]EJC99699.1 farnesyl-diphosphate farnesyltransferase [Fomitiporia mediterranea MF3/22]
MSRAEQRKLTGCCHRGVVRVSILSSASFTRLRCPFHSLSPSLSPFLSSSPSSSPSSLLPYPLSAFSIMGATDLLLLLFTHPNEFRTLTQFWIYHEQKRDITSAIEYPTSGYDRESMRRCWYFLDMTSRSFSSVIKELDGELARVICLFYLVLRGLDTIEDDMTIADEVKQPLLRSFAQKCATPGWTFTGNGPRERDRQLLVEFNVVIDELLRLDPSYLTVILDICDKMAQGMADYAHLAYKTGTLGLGSMEDLDLYCHYVAGLVGEGLSRLFSASGKEVSWLGDQLALSNAMGLLLQKTNVLRDFREDVDAGRLFWPRAIWSESFGFADPREMYKPENEQRALWCLSAMTLDALRHAVDSLEYIALLKTQSVFNFCAIPQTMAMATLALCFMNPAVFHRNVKIRKAAAARLIMRSTNPRDVAYMFRDYARDIHAKAVPADPNFLRISVACGKIELWCESHYPSFVLLPSPGSQAGYSLNELDARARIAHRDAEITSAVRRRKRIEELRASGAIQNGELREAGPVHDLTTSELVMWIIGIFIAAIALGGGIVWVIIRYFS